MSSMNVTKMMADFRDHLTVSSRYFGDTPFRHNRWMVRENPGFVSAG